MRRLLGPRVCTVASPAPQHRAIELEPVAHLLQAGGDRLVNAVGMGGADLHRHVGDEPLEVQVRLGRGRRPSFEVEPLGDANH